MEWLSFRALLTLIRKLADVLSIPSLLCDKVIEEIEVELLSKARKFKSYIFIETDFKRKGESVLILSALQSQRFLDVKEEVQCLSLNNQIDVVCEQIKEHYQQQQSLDLWGEIQKYVFYYDKSLVLQFSLTGELIEASEGYSYSKAVLMIQ